MTTPARLPVLWRYVVPATMGVTALLSPVGMSLSFGGSMNGDLTSKAHPDWYYYPGTVLMLLPVLLLLAGLVALPFLVRAGHRDPAKPRVAKRLAILLGVQAGILVAIPVVTLGALWLTMIGSGAL